MATKSVFTDPTPGDRLARRLVLDLNRDVEFFINDRDEAIAANDPALIQQVNQKRTNIEQTANELRAMENIPEKLAGRVRDALTRADSLLVNYEPIQPRIHADESRGNRTQDEERNTPPPPDEDVEDLLYPGRDTSHPATLHLSQVSLPLSSPHSHGAASEFFETRDYVSGSGSRGRSSISPSSSRHLDAEAAAQAAQRQIDSARDRLEAEADQLQAERERIAREERELERRQRRLNVEMRNADSLEQARLRDQQENDQELASHRAGLTRDWVNNQAQFQPSASTPAVALTRTSPVLNQVPRPAATQSGLQQNQPLEQQPHTPMPQQQSQDPLLLQLIQQMQQQMQLQSQQLQQSKQMQQQMQQQSQQMQQQTQQQLQQIRQEVRQQTSSPSLQPGAPPFTPNGAAPPPPPSQAGSNISVAAAPSLLQGDVAQSLLTVNLRSHSRDLMIQGRPPKENRFTGDDSQDFESFMTQFEAVTSLDGVTDQMIFSELKFWVHGNAKIAVTQYDNEKDPSEALRKAKAHLRREFGQRVLTARQMLDGLLTGGKLDQKDTESIRGLVLKLEQVHRRAVETDRERTFSTRETYRDILSKKLPFFTHKWAKIIEDNEERKFNDPSVRDLGFLDFINYLRKSNKILMCKAGLSDTPAPATKEGAGKGAKGSKVAATSAQIAATGAEVAATMTSKPKNKGPAKANPSKTYASAAKPGGKDADTSNSPKGTAPKSCVACKTETHELSCCREFLKRSDTEKQELVKKNGLCYLCLAHGHLSAKCPENIVCNECGRRHNTVFHREDQEKSKEDI